MDKQQKINNFYFGAKLNSIFRKQRNELLLNEHKTKFKKRLVMNKKQITN